MGLLTISSYMKVVIVVKRRNNNEVGTFSTSLIRHDFLMRKDFVLSMVGNRSNSRLFVVERHAEVFSVYMCACDETLFWVVKYLTGTNLTGPVR